MRASARSLRGIEERLKRKRGKQDQAGIAVRLEYRQTDVRVVDLESGDLPTERAEWRLAAQLPAALASLPAPAGYRSG